MMLWRRLRRGIPFSGLKRSGRNNKEEKRLSFEQAKNRSREGDVEVIKGTSKRVIVVKSPDPGIFEQAIFIIREDFAGQNGVSEKDVLLQARRAANAYLGSGRTRRQRLTRLRAALFAAAGAACTAVAWFAVTFIRV